VITAMASTPALLMVLKSSRSMNLCLGYLPGLFFSSYTDAYMGLGKRSVRAPPCAEVLVRGGRFINFARA
jgi:hypothetical protein